MKYTNPVIKGMYPDPSVCCVNNTYYLVNSTFEYMPAIPVFKSEDLVNWEQIGNAIVDPTEFGIEDTPNSGGIFAPTIRFNQGQYYIITTCFGRKGLKNFFITAENPAGPWSKPVFIDIEGIDPSLYWEDGNTYIQYTAFGTIMQVSINEFTGEILRGPEVITKGCGGRDTEGPHMWKRNGYYYLLLAEGGTREGHMVTLMRSKSIWGPFEASPYLPVVSNKDYAREPLQCVGHADWIQGRNGEDYLVALAVRHVKHKTILGRETVLTPAYWTDDGWLKVDMTNMPIQAETSFEGEQKINKEFNLDIKSNKLPMQIISPRKRHDELVKFTQDAVYITGNQYSLHDEQSPVLLALRQTEYDFCMSVTLSFEPKNQSDEAGIAMYTDNMHHFSLFISKRIINEKEEKVLVFRKCVDDIITENVIKPDFKENITLIIEGDKLKYNFKYIADSIKSECAGWTYNKHLASSCINSPNTGVVGGMFVVGENTTKICQFTYKELDNAK